MVILTNQVSYLSVSKETIQSTLNQLRKHLSFVFSSLPEVTNILKGWWLIQLLI